jgi:hypothetical protein
VRGDVSDADGCIVAIHTEGQEATNCGSTDPELVSVWVANLLMATARRREEIICRCVMF